MLGLIARKTMLTRICILKCKTAEEATEKMPERLKELPEQARKSVTFDNGGAKHDVVAQKLGIEHANGRLRRYIPRWMNLKDV
ncbi:MAG: hypothetical protein Q8K36_05655 [Alphaproteobacteria bacterium]|nr:hypothetical protein [Alphaproteobacteria bacterium]